jgi:UDP-2,4-diacetamido-2,4,6-trideoxy-beta-L-altropyranose hydrolase
MDIMIRTDSSFDIGTGHVMRCLTLADEMRKGGADVGFVCRDLPGNLVAYVERRGYPVHRLPATPELADDIQFSVDILRTRNAKPDWLIVDSYSLDRAWEHEMRPNVENIAVIDDLADKPHDCDLLLNQDDILGDMGKRYSRLVPAGCKLLLGPRFTLLRPEFAEKRAGRSEHGGKVNRILVSFGGSDPSNETSKVLEAMRLSGRKDIQADLIVGMANPNRAMLESMALGIPNVSLHLQSENMAEMMLRADLAIGGGGMTLWERCCMGLPSLVAIQADNQDEIVRAVAELGAIINLGRVEDLTAKDYLFAMDNISAGRLADMTEKGMGLVDGKGAQRVADAMHGQLKIYDN